MFSVLSNTPRNFFRYLIFFTGLLLTACTPIAGVGVGPSINTRSAVKVALLVPGGSARAGDALLASNLENAAKLAIADLNGAKIDLAVYNTAGQAETAANAARQAVRDGAKIIIGPVYAEAANAAGLAVRGQNVNVLAFSNNASIAGGNVFVLGPTFQNTANRLVDFAQSRGKDRIMIVHAQSTAGQAGRDAITTAIGRSGATLATTSSYEFSQQGVISAAPQIAEAAKASGANAVFFTSDTSGALPLLAQLLPERGLDPTIYQFIGLTRWDIPANTLAMPGVQGAWFARPDQELSARFSARYSAAYGQNPHPLAGLSYDAIAAIGALIRSGKSNALTTTALTQSSGFVGTNGIFRLLSDGTNERGLAIVQIENGTLVTLDPAPRSFGGAGF